MFIVIRDVHQYINHISKEGGDISPQSFAQQLWGLLLNFD